VKIVFATIGNTRDIRRGSGTPYHLWQSLLKAGVEVHLVGPLEITMPLPTHFFRWISRQTGKKYSSYRDPFMGARLGMAVGHEIEDVDYDLLLTNDYCIAGYTRSKKPVVLYTDDDFPIKFSENVNQNRENLSRYSIFFSQMTTRKGLKKAGLCLFASQFAADSAAEYGFQDQYKVIPYGANIADPGNEFERSTDKLGTEGRIDLLFVGKDWERKGGAIAVEAVRILQKKGNNAHLHIVGVDSVENVQESYIHFYGILNKDISFEREKLESLYQTCDALIVPSKSEGYGLVFVEAAAYGMPSLAYATTGVMTAVKAGESGILLSSEQTAEDFAEVIFSWIDKPDFYKRLSQGARLFYQTMANWDVTVSQLVFELELLGKAKAK